VILLVYGFVFLPGSRVRLADRLLAVYSTTRDPGIAQRLVDMVDLERVPLRKREQILRTVLRPVARTPTRYVTGGQVVIRFERPSVRFERHVVAEGFDYDIGPAFCFEGRYSNDPFAELFSFEMDASFEELPDGRQTLLPGRYFMLASLRYILLRKEAVPGKGLRLPWTHDLGRYRLSEVLSTSDKMRVDFDVVEPCGPCSAD
jgi:hypothetical protein